jgi:hypothetical protein
MQGLKIHSRFPSAIGLASEGDFQTCPKVKSAYKMCLPLTLPQDFLTALQGRRDPYPDPHFTDKEPDGYIVSNRTEFDSALSPQVDV